MRLSNRHLGYLVITGVFAVLLLLWVAQKSNQGPPPSPSTREIEAAPLPKPSAPAPVRKVPAELCRKAAFFIAKMKKDRVLDYRISPDGLSSLVYVEPKIWQSFVHQEKVAFVQMFIDFFLCQNQKHPESKPVPFFAVLNLTTREHLARGWLIGGGEGYPPGTVEVFE